MNNYGDPNYWEDRYAHSEGKVFEWYDLTRIKLI